MLPRSAQQRIARDSSKGKISGRSHEIQRLIGRSLRSVTRLDKLGQRTIWIDCDVIQADGGTRTAAITGSFIALVDAVMHLLADGKIQVNPITDFVAATSVGIVKGTQLLDLSYDEDSTADVDMNVIMTGNNHIVEIQGTAEKKAFSRQDMNQLMDLAESGIYSLIEIQKQALEIQSL
jgi:ribonuclease PH